MEEYYKLLGYCRDIVFGEDKPCDTLGWCLLALWIAMLGGFAYIVISGKA